MTGQRLVQILASFGAAVVAVVQSQTNEASYDIAFVGASQGQRDVYIRRGDGSQHELLLAESIMFLGPWSPDGKKIAYSCEGVAEHMELMKKYPLPMHFALCVVNVDGTGRQQLLDVWETLSLWLSSDRRWGLPFLPRRR